MQTHHLICHPATTPVSLTSIDVIFGHMPDGKAMLRFILGGTGSLIVPPPAGKGHRDGLWKHSCFELFLMREGQPYYREFNFSPSGHWAAYEFSDYRAGMARRELSDWPDLHFQQGSDRYSATIFLGAAELAGFTHAGLNVVVQEKGGHLSYWALCHTKETPDFHEAACFAMPLVAPD